MDLAIINISDSVVATTNFTLQRGERVKVSAYYRNEDALRSDLEVQRYVAGRKLLVAPVDFEGVEKQMDVAAALNAADDAAMAAALRVRIQRGKNAIAQRVVDQQQARERRQSERRVRDHAVENTRLNELAALFEQQRKERLQRAAAGRRPTAETETVNRVFDEKQQQLARDRARLGEPPPSASTAAKKKTAPSAPPPPAAAVPPTPPPPPETSAGLVDTGEQLPPSSLPPDPAGGEILEPSRLPDAPPSDEQQPSDEQADTTLTPSAAPIEQTTPASEDPTVTVPTMDAPRDITVESLSDQQLRYILKEFEVSGRKKLKTHDALVEAVRSLELAAEDLARLAADAQKGGE